MFNLQMSDRCCSEFYYFSNKRENIDRENIIYLAFVSTETFINVRNLISF